MKIILNFQSPPIVMTKKWQANRLKSCYPFLKFISVKKKKCFCISRVCKWFSHANPVLWTAWSKFREVLWIPVRIQPVIGSCLNLTDFSKIFWWRQQHGCLVYKQNWPQSPVLPLFTPASAILVFSGALGPGLASLLLPGSLVGVQGRASDRIFSTISAKKVKWSWNRSPGTGFKKGWYKLLNPQGLP